MMKNSQLILGEVGKVSDVGLSHRQNVASLITTSSENYRFPNGPHISIGKVQHY